jgi:beta-glucanase (GH16 family)
VGPSYASAGSPVTGTLQLTASSSFTAQAVGIAVRTPSGVHYDYPGAARNVSLGPGIYTFKSLSRTFPAGTYSVFGFWQDMSGVYHSLPAITRPVGSAASGTQPAGMQGSWTLKKDAEFNGSSLDTTMWRPGWFGSGLTGPVAASEQACYNAANVAFPGDGSVHLKVTATPSTCGGVTRPYTGALLSSNPSDGRASGGFQYTYGAMEARVYVPAAGTGIANWPAVWADGQTWPNDGEDDVMEGLGGQACFHFHSPSGGPGTCVAGNTSGWHTFGSDWEPGVVTYYYDGVQVGQITTGVTSSPMYLVLSNTVSSTFGGPTVAPADMQVASVRVWQH